MVAGRGSQKEKSIFFTAQLNSGEKKCFIFIIFIFLILVFLWIGCFFGTWLRATDGYRGETLRCWGWLMVCAGSSTATCGKCFNL